jgi:hypothetical protein
MMLPKMTKFAARRGVGAIIVQQILFVGLVNTFLVVQHSTVSEKVSPGMARYSTTTFQTNPVSR